MNDKGPRQVLRQKLRDFVVGQSQFHPIHALIALYPEGLPPLPPIGPHSRVAYPSDRRLQ